MKSWMDDGWVGGGWMDRWVDGWMNTWMDRQMDDGRIDGELMEGR